MRIAYDEQAFQMQQFGGISRYITRVAEVLGFAGETVRVFAPIHCNYYLHHSTVPKMVWLAVNAFPPKTGRLIRAFNRCMTAQQIAAWKPEVIHETSYSSRPLGRLRCPTVVTVHDMIHERLPHLFSDSGRWSREKAIAVSRADHVICVSESTRRDLCDILNFPPAKTSVVHHGVDIPVLPQNDDRPTAASNRPYILYIGVRGGYKNFNNLLKAFAYSARLRAEFDLLLFGGPPISAREIAMAVKSGLQPSQLRHAGQCENVRASLYRHAVAFVYPSLYEGFGMPLLEAMAHGCPVVASRYGPCPEVAADAAEYFDAYDAEDISRAIECVVFSPIHRETLVQRGYKRAALFSWENCAMNTWKAYVAAASA